MSLDIPPALPLGQYAGVPLDNVPIEYCYWLYANHPNIIPDDMKLAVRRRIAGFDPRVTAESVPMGTVEDRVLSAIIQAEKAKLDDGDEATAELLDRIETNARKGFKREHRAEKEQQENGG